MFFLALNLVDLEREGLVEYRYLLKQIDSNHPSNSVSFSIENSNNNSNGNTKTTNPDLLSGLYKSLEIDSNNTLSLKDAEKLLSRLNSRLGKRQEGSSTFSNLIEANPDGRIDFNEFKNIFEQQLNN